jgi:hypothetical protein
MQYATGPCRPAGTLSTVITNWQQQGGVVCKYTDWKFAHSVAESYEPRQTNFVTARLPDLQDLQGLLRVLVMCL